MVFLKRHKPQNTRILPSSRRRSLKKLARQFSSRSVLLKVLIVAVLVLFFSQLKIKRIKTEFTSPPNYVTADQISTCLKVFKGKNLFLTPSSKIQTRIKECEPMIATVLVYKIPPSTLKVRLTEHSPLLQIETPKKCAIIEANQQKLVKLNKCLTDTKLPKLKTETLSSTTSISFVIGYLQANSRSFPNQLARKFVEETYKGKEVLKIEYGDISVIVDPLKDPDEEFLKFYNTYIGLKQQHKKAKVINLLFDRIIVK